MNQTLHMVTPDGLRFMWKPCKRTVEAFLFFTLTFILVNASYAISLSNHVITDDQKANSNCTTPTPKTAFSPTDSKVYSWVLLSNAFPLDTVTWKWFSPGNSPYGSATWNVRGIGSICGACEMGIAGNPRQTRPAVGQLKSTWAAPLPQRTHSPSKTRPSPLFRK